MLLGLEKMTCDPLLKTGDIEIEHGIARFGPTTYQLAAITGLSVDKRRRINVAALSLLLFSIGFLLSGLLTGGYLVSFTLAALKFDIAPYFFGATLVLLVLGAVIQIIWPRQTFTLTLKTPSGDVEALVSEDESHVASVRRALEGAFAPRT